MMGTSGSRELFHVLFPFKCSGGLLQFIYELFFGSFFPRLSRIAAAAGESISSFCPFVK